MTNIESEAKALGKAAVTGLSGLIAARPKTVMAIVAGLALLATFFAILAL